MAKTMKHESCVVIRTILVRHGKLDLATGKTIMDQGIWETKPCNIPLFGEAERLRGVCKSCASGWSHPENYPAYKESNHGN